MFKKKKNIIDNIIEILSLIENENKKPNIILVDKETYKNLHKKNYIQMYKQTIFNVPIKVNNYIKGFVIIPKKEREEK